MRHPHVVALAFCAFATGTFAQEAAKPAAGKALPKVVLLGDSVREHYAPFVAELLAGRATVVTPKANGGDTRKLLTNLNEWAIKEQPDVIHFNCGIHDTKRDQKTGKYNVPPEQYETNLREIVKRLRTETKAKLVFALSTPLIDERSKGYWKTRSYQLFNASVMEYKVIALRVMKELDVPVNDLPAVLGDAKENARLHDSGGIHFTKEGSQKLAGAVVAFVTQFLAAPSQASLPAQPLNLHSGPQLFLDDHLIASREGLKREVRQPQRYGNPVLDSRTFGVTQPYLTVLRDPETKRFRMFYNSGPAIWHAESEDGIRWANPRLAYACPRGYGCSVVDDRARDADPSRRFKLANWAGTPGRGDKPGDDTGMWIGFSPDGFAWTLYDKNPVLPTWPEGYDKRVRHGIGDTLDVYYDNDATCYRTSVKVNGFPEDGWAPAPKAGKTFRRLVGMSSSKDFLNWEKPWRILVPDDKDGGLLEFYGMGGMHVRGGLHIGLVRVLRDDLPCDPGGPKDGIGYTVLATSRDGVKWHRFREPFLDRNPEPGSWDHAMTWMSQAVPVGDELYFYYGGYARGHKIESKTERQIGLARMKRDRYVALAPEAEHGTLLTQPFLFPGGTLTINADAAKGEVGVRLLDDDGNSLSHSEGANAIKTDALSAEVQWSKPLDPYQGKPVRLEFKVRNAALYGFEWHFARG